MCHNLSLAAELRNRRSHSMGTNLRQKQTAMLVRMLNFNVPLPDGLDGAADGSGWSETWKVLVYDRKCRDIISPLLNVSKLRKRGVTLHLLLESDREDIPDVPAVYFVEPTAENIQRIGTDCSKRLYSAFHLNFVSKLDRSLMEKLARGTISTNSHTLITRVYDQYLDFVTLEPKLFTLNMPDSYLRYNNPGAGEQDMQDYARGVTYGIFSVLATMGAVPVIRCAPGGPAEMVGQQLNSLISDHLMQGSSNFFSSSSSGAARGAPSTASFHRPLLILIDRNEDLITSLHHTSTYQALVDDVLQHKLNRVNIETTAQGEAPKRRTYDLDVEGDAFYARHAGSLFPEAIQANSTDLAEVSKKEEEIRSKTMSQFGGGANDDMQDGAKGLLSAVDSLPQLLERKKLLEVHTNILQAIFGSIAAREVPVLFEMEESMVLTSRGDKNAIKPILADTTKATLQDKLRLLAVYTLATKASSADLTELQDVLREAYANTPTPCPPNWPSQQDVEAGIGAVDYLRRQRSVQHLPDRGEVEAAKAQQGGVGSGGYVSTFISKAQTQATGLLAKASHLLSRRNTLYVTRVVDNLCTSKPNSEDDTYLYLDPKVKGLDPSSLKGRAPPREVIVFMIGGGCYAEYQNLLEHGRQQPATAPRSIVYGCTELVNAEAFITQLTELGRKLS